MIVEKRKKEQTGSRTIVEGINSRASLKMFSHVS